ncbi:MFS transporter [Vineibacter terrae]|uniref:MFS transporter n=1 Tax=Vineibacter terrae TaxID=2586908 RepID=A0A5C8PS39_9HYPH|nr:MFS transporter [Vineibacter terrae]TXL78178.1 MFS transporter [Vineibacter terrae]
MRLIARVPALAPFGVRSFRFQWPADLATSWAFEMETLILGWYILVETGSVVILAAFGSLQFLGTLVAPLFGVAGDRIGYRNLLCLMRATYATLAAILMILFLTGTASPAAVFAVAVAAGTVRPSDLVMRNVLIGDTMPPALLMRAMGVSRTTMDSARVAGALAGAGLVASLGTGPAYIAICGFYVLSLLLTLGVAGGGALAPGTARMRASPLRDLRDGLAYIWSTPPLRATMYLAFLVNLTVFPLTGALLAHVAKDVYHLDQRGLGWLVASFAAGALTGSIALSVLGAAIRPARIMLVYGVLWYAATIAFAHAAGPTLGCAILLVAGLVQSLCMVPMAVALLRTVPPALRGCIMGVRMLAVYGYPVGLLAAGPLIERFGFAATATAYCTVGLCFLLVIAVRWREHLWRTDAVANTL